MLLPAKEIARDHDRWHDFTLYRTKGDDVLVYDGNSEELFGFGDVASETPAITRLPYDQLGTWERETCPQFYVELLRELGEDAVIEIE